MSQSAALPRPVPLVLADLLPGTLVRDILLVVGSVAVAALLFRRGQLTSPDRNPGVVTLLLVGGFLLGVVMNAATSWWRDRGHRASRLVEDVRALV